MKKFYAMSLAVAAAMSVSAQQLPSVGFEQDWVDSTPWISLEGSEGTTLVKGDAMGAITFGLQPAGWCASNVLGLVSYREADEDGGWEAGYAGLGATEVIAKAEGNGSATAVKLTNTPNPFMTSQIVPAYLTLGKTWSTSYVDFMTYSPAGTDGGSFGGVACTSKPDALQFYYKRSNAAANADDATIKPESSTILAYLWKGNWTQADVPGNINMSQSGLVKVPMVNRDRNILGMETAQGGAVTKSDDAELIAKLLVNLDEEKTEWTKFEMPIEYLSDATPEMLNVVISAGDYFGGASVVGKGNNITVDDVKLLYYSRIKSLKLGDMVIPMEDGKYDYEFAMDMPGMAALAQFSYELIGKGAKLAIMPVAANKVQLTVTNDGEDADGLKQHVYTLTFNGAQGEPDTPVTEAKTYNGYLTVNMLGDDITKDQDATIEITILSDVLCNFKMPNFQIDLGSGPMPLGDIVVNNVDITREGAATRFNGHVDHLLLLGGAIDATVDVKGLITDDGDIDLSIPVIWNMEDGGQMPIMCSFKSSKTDAISTIAADADNAPVEYYNLNGVRVTNPQAGLYIRRQGGKVTKVLVK